MQYSLGTHDKRSVSPRESEEARQASPIILTGMHRSGTSMMARFLHASGVDMGRDLVPGGPGNERGHFEDVRFLEFHSRILHREYGSGAWGPGPPSLTSRDREDALRLLTSRSASGMSPWGWKDPRTALFLDLWAELAPEACFVFLVREPSQVADSLCRRMDKLYPGLRSRRNSWWGHSREMLLYLRYWRVFNRAIADFVARSSRRIVLISLAKLLQDPEHHLARLGDTTALSLHSRDFEMLFDGGAMKCEPVPVPLLCSLELWRCRRVYAQSLSK